ncbi:MAG: hypothetical protein H6617_07725 [Bdellovibrionaceae bacterium]|nr:hypothetical protein [Bdellovibrionales bacterium]MCB9254555.1 hypothetical protein [Pseudobdellovibrionaceae bacterium]
MKRVSLLFFVFVSVGFAQVPMDPKVAPRSSVKDAAEFHARLRPLNWGRGGEAGDFPPRDYPIEDEDSENQWETPPDFPGGVPSRDGYCVGVVEFRRMAHLAQVRGLPVPYKVPTKRVAYIKKMHVSVNLKIERAIVKWQQEAQRWLGARLMDGTLMPAERKLYGDVLKDISTREGAIAFNALRSVKQLVNYGTPFGALGARLYVTGLAGAQGHAIELFVLDAKAKIVDPNIGDVTVEPKFDATGIHWIEANGKAHNYGLAFGAPWKWIPLSAVYE